MHGASYIHMELRPRLDAGAAGRAIKMNEAVVMRALARFSLSRRVAEDAGAAAMPAQCRYRFRTAQVILIAIDTLRADTTWPATAIAPASTAAISIGMARTGMVFANVYSQAS